MCQSQTLPAAGSLAEPPSPAPDAHLYGECPQCGCLPVSEPLFLPGMSVRILQASTLSRELFFTELALAYNNLEAIDPVIDLIERAGTERKFPNPRALAALLRCTLWEVVLHMERAARCIDKNDAP